MKLLLDTHILVWSLLEPERLSPRSVSLLEDPTTDLYLSPITPWELLVLAEKDRLELPSPHERWIRDMLTRVPCKEAPLTFEVAVQSRLVALPHQDPADRFLVATALVYDLTLLTADGRILSAEVCQVLPNT